MKQLILAVVVIICLACSVQAAAVTNYIVNEWCTNAAWATNPYGNWIYQAGYNGDRLLPYQNFTNFVEGPMDWEVNWKRCAWLNVASGEAPIAALDYWSNNPDDDCAELQTSTNGINTSIGWIAPNAGMVEQIFIKWKTASSGSATNASNVYIDHVRGTSMLDTKYMFTNDYIHDYFGIDTIDVSTPFAVQAGDIIYISFVRRDNALFQNNLIFGSRWGNDSYIVFTPVPEPGSVLALLAGLILLLRRR